MLKITAIYGLIAALTLVAAQGETQGSPKTEGAAPEASTTKTAPGLIRWHDSIEAATLASRTSGRPVLRFQLLGRLDERFC